MKLKLDVYPEIAVLKLSETVGTYDIQVLRAGLSRILELPVSWLFIDAGVALMSQAQAYGLMELRHIKSTIFCECVLPYAIPGAFRSLDGALSICTAPSASALREKIHLEGKRDEINDKLSLYRIQLDGFKRQGKTIENLEEENRQLRLFHVVLKAGLNAGGLTEELANPLVVTSKPESMKKLLEAKKDWIIWLKKNEVLK